MFLDVCKVNLLLANLAAIYIIASIYYIIYTKTYFSTPLTDMIHKIPKLTILKQKSSTKRTKVFFFGIFLGLLWHGYTAGLLALRSSGNNAYNTPYGPNITLISSKASEFTINII